METVLDNLDKYKENTVIVEGKKDKEALENLEFKDVRELKGALFSFVEDLDVRKVSILTDLDREGKRLYSKLKQLCSKNGIKVDDKLRRELFKTKVRQIEGIRDLF